MSEMAVLFIIIENVLCVVCIYYLLCVEHLNLNQLPKT